MKSADRVNAMKGSDFMSPDHISNLFDDLQDEIPFMGTFGPVSPINKLDPVSYGNEPFIPEDNKWTNEIVAMAKNTPDFRELKNGKDKEFLILVCDSLQLGRNMNHLLSAANYYGRGQSLFNGYILKKSRDGMAVPFRMKSVGYRGAHGWAYPNNFTCMRSQDVGALEGDVYGVPLRHLTVLDRLKDNTRKCNRQRGMVHLNHSRQRGQYCNAYIWEGDHLYYTKHETEPQFMSSHSMLIRQNIQVVYN